MKMRRRIEKERKKQGSPCCKRKKNAKEKKRNGRERMKEIVKADARVKLLRKELKSQQTQRIGLGRKPEKKKIENWASNPISRPKPT
jgi:hypothetical protein